MGAEQSAVVERVLVSISVSNATLGIIHLLTDTVEVYLQHRSLIQEMLRLKRLRDNNYI